jgi:hypothetical protein
MMGLKTVAEQWAEQEGKSGYRHQVKKKQSGGSGASIPMTLLAIAFLILAIAALPYLLQRPAGGGSAAFWAPSMDNVQQMTALAYQQQQLAYGMTQTAGQIYSSTANAQAVAAATAQAVQANAILQATSTSWAMTQPALEATQIRSQLNTQHMQDVERLRYAILPFQVWFWPVFWIVVAVALFALIVIAIALVLPGLAEKSKNWARVIKEERGERTIIHTPGAETVLPHLQTQPVLRHKEGEPVTSAGGFEDPQLQAGVVEGANYTKAIQALPVGTRLPGHRVPEKALPQIEILNGRDQKLLEDTRKAVDGEEV